MSTNSDVIVNVMIYGHFGAIRKPDSRGIVYKTYIFINSDFLSSKIKKEVKNLKHTSHTIALSNGTSFFLKNSNFCKKMLTSAKFTKP